VCVCVSFRVCVYVCLCVSVCVCVCYSSRMMEEEDTSKEGEGGTHIICF